MGVFSSLCVGASHVINRTIESSYRRLIELLGTIVKIHIRIVMLPSLHANNFKMFEVSSVLVILEATSSGYWK